MKPISFSGLKRTKNISLAKDGILALARKAMTLYTHDDDSGFGTPVAIVTDSQYAYVATASGHFFVIDTTANVFSIQEANATNQPTLGLFSDAVIFNGKVNVSGDTTISAIAFGQGQSWPSPKKVTGLTDDVPHPLCVVEHLNQLAVGNGNSVKTYDTSYSNQATLTIPAEYVVTKIFWRKGILYIATRHIYGGDAKIFVWNGTGSSANDGYTIPGVSWVYSLCDYLDSVALITSAGQLLRFNGGGFEVLASLPVYDTPYSWASTAATESLVGRVACRGMEAVGKRLYIMLDGSLNNTAGVGPGIYLPDQPSGLWCFEPGKGLYHVSGVNYFTKHELTASECNSSYLKFSTAHQAQTGDPVLCASVSALTEVTAGIVYYAIVDENASTTTLRLALSPADADAGRAITITGTPDTDRFTFDRYETFGETLFDIPGPICILRRARFNAFFASDIIFGASALDESLTAKGVLLSLGMGRNRGHIVTEQIPADGLKDAFQSLLAILKPLRLDTDQILFKGRTKERFGLPTPPCITGSATWTSSTTFTIDITTKDVQSVAIGDEIEVIKGAAAGYTAHITNISKSGNTWTITIDETMPVSSGSFDFIADNWKLLGTLTSANTKESFIKTALKAPSDARWMQLKIELRGRHIELDGLAIINAVKQNV